MQRIKLTQNKYALVDDDDFDFLNQWKWYFNSGYAVRGNKEKILMHRVVNHTSKGIITDHINGDKLDNRKCNLRDCTNEENQMNRGAQANNTSGYKGVTWSNKAGKWYAQIQYHGKRKHLGSYNTPQEASEVYNKEAKILFKGFCHF